MSVHVFCYEDHWDVPDCEVFDSLDALKGWVVNYVRETLDEYHNDKYGEEYRKELDRRGYDYAIRWLRDSDYRPEVYEKLVLSERGY